MLVSLADVFQGKSPLQGPLLPPSLQHVPSPPPPVRATAIDVEGETRTKLGRNLAPWEVCNVYSGHWKC